MAMSNSQRVYKYMVSCGKQFFSIPFKKTIFGLRLNSSHLLDHNNVITNNKPPLGMVYVASMICEDDPPLMLQRNHEHNSGNGQCIKLYIIIITIIIYYYY